MICIIPNVPGGYQVMLKIENMSFQLIINLDAWFPNTKKNIKKLFFLMKENDPLYMLDQAISYIIEELYDYRKTCELLGSLQTVKKLDKNIEYLKVLNGLYGG